MQSRAPQLLSLARLLQTLCICGQRAGRTTLPLHWWPHSQVLHSWLEHIQGQAGLSLGVHEDIHVQESSSRGVFGAKDSSLKVAFSSVSFSSTQALCLLLFKVALAGLLPLLSPLICLTFSDCQ